MRIHNVFGLLLLVGLLLSSPGSIWSQDAQVTVTPGPALPISRAHHTATRLRDGRILLVGGSTAPDVHLADVAIFDPRRNTTTAAAPLHTARHGHTATLLRDGRVLVVGGYTLPQQWLADAEVYNPATNTWAVIPPLSAHGVGHTATLLRDGRVLVVGGCIGSGVCTDRVELFNPRRDAWTTAAALPSDRAAHAALLLDTGRVLIVGGAGAMGAPDGGDALIYNPRRDSWTATGPMVTPRFNSAVTRLRDGRVLAAGGMALPGSLPQLPLSSVEVYDPATNRWVAAAALGQPRYAFALATLPGGQVLAVGGARDDHPQWADASFVHAIEQYDPRADRWESVGELPLPRAYAAAALLADGRLWITGGQTGHSGAAFWADTWMIKARRCEPRTHDRCAARASS